MDRRSGNALDMESDGFPLRNKKRNFDRGQIPVFKIPLPLQMVGVKTFDTTTSCPSIKFEQFNHGCFVPNCENISVLSLLCNREKFSAQTTGLLFRNNHKMPRKKMKNATFRFYLKWKNGISAGPKVVSKIPYILHFCKNKQFHPVAFAQFV